MHASSLKLYSWKLMKTHPWHSSPHAFYLNLEYFLIDTSYNIAVVRGKVNPLYCMFKEEMEKKEKYLFIV